MVCLHCVHQSDSDRLYIYIHFQILFPYTLLQSAEYISLCFRVGPCWLSILYAVVYIYWRRQWQPTPILLPGKSHGLRSLIGCSAWGREELDTTEQLHFHFHALEKEMATHSSVLAWRIPGTGEPGGLPSMGVHRVGHDRSNLAAAAAAAVYIC